MSKKFSTGISDGARGGGGGYPGDGRGFLNPKYKQNIFISVK